MKMLLLAVLLSVPAWAEQCEVLEMATNAEVTVRTNRIYTVRLDKSVYQIVPQRNWFPRLVVGQKVECRVKNNDVIIKDGYHYKIVSEKPAQ
jgi:hypothetical protein